MQQHALALIKRVSTPPMKRAPELSSASTLIMLPATTAATPCWVRCATDTELAVMPQNGKARRRRP